MELCDKISEYIYVCRSTSYYDKRIHSCNHLLLLGNSYNIPINITVQIPYVYIYIRIYDSYNKVIYNCFTRNMNMMWLRSMEKIIKSNNLVKHPLYCLYDTFGNGFLSIVC